MFDLINCNDAMDQLSTKGCIYMGHLLFRGKCICINNRMYMTQEQFNQCKEKDTY